MFVQKTVNPVHFSRMYVQNFTYFVQVRRNLVHFLYKVGEKMNNLVHFRRNVGTYRFSRIPAPGNGKLVSNFYLLPGACARYRQYEFKFSSF